MDKEIKGGRFAKFIRKAFTTDDVFKENEIKANQFVAIVMFASAGLLLLCWLLNAVHVFQTGATMNRVAFICAIGLLVPAVLCTIFKGEKSWIKYALLGELVLAMAYLDGVLSYNVTLCILLPLVLSCRYCNSYFTAQVSIFTSICFLGFTILCVLTEEQSFDLNFFDPDPGQIIELDLTKYGTISDALKAIAEYSPGRRLQEYMLLGFLPKWMIYCIISFACVLISSRGYAMVSQQAKISEKSAKISSELNLASDIQASMLPSIFPPFPDHQEFDIYALMNPAKEVGGDFYDFFMIDDSHIAIVIADVSGKGVPAALFMVTAKTLIKDHAQLGLAPAEVFTRVNKILCSGNEAGLFVTGWMGVLDINTGILTYVNAGHNAPLLFNAYDGFEYLKSAPGFVLAGLESVRYKQSELKLNKGAKIFLYTDGVTEATSSETKLYGEERLQNYLTAHKHDSIRDIVDGVRGDIDLFVGDAEQFDDITMLVLDYRSHLVVDNEQLFEANIDKLPDAMAFVEETLEKNNVPMNVVSQITVCFEEVFVNIAHYAYPGRYGTCKISCAVEDHEIRLVAKDHGIPFNPLNKEDPDITMSAQDRQIGGLGIFMVKKVMDDVSYEYKDEMNVLTMRKRF